MSATKKRTTAKKVRPPKMLRMTDLAQVRALSHPLRLRLLELFSRRPQTTKQAATELGEAPTRLYHHVAALEKAGLLRLRETRQNRGTTEKYYENATTRILADEKVAGAGGGARRDLAAMGLIVFDQARNELVRALANPAVGDEPALMAVRGVIRLSPAGARKLEKNLLKVVTGLQPPKAGLKLAANRRRYSLTVALIPADENEA